MLPLCKCDKRCSFCQRRAARCHLATNFLSSCPSTSSLFSSFLFKVTFSAWHVFSPFFDDHGNITQFPTLISRISKRYCLVCFKIRVLFCISCNKAYVVVIFLWFQRDFLHFVPRGRSYFIKKFISEPTFPKLTWHF